MAPRVAIRLDLGNDPPAVKLLLRTADCGFEVFLVLEEGDYQVSFKLRNLEQAQALQAGFAEAAFELEPLG